MWGPKGIVIIILVVVVDMAFADRAVSLWALNRVNPCLGRDWEWVWDWGLIGKGIDYLGLGRGGMRMVGWCLIWAVIFSNFFLLHVSTPSTLNPFPFPQNTPNQTHLPLTSLQHRLTTTLYVPTLQPLSITATTSYPTTNSRWTFTTFSKFNSTPTPPRY